MKKGRVLKFSMFGNWNFNVSLASFNLQIFSVGEFP